MLSFCALLHAYTTKQKLKVSSLCFFFLASKNKKKKKTFLLLSFWFETNLIVSDVQKHSLRVGVPLFMGEKVSNCFFLLKKKHL
jgi:hypothetical protein